jgi:hypothetical protein
LIELDLSENPVAELPGYRELIFREYINNHSEYLSLRHSTMLIKMVNKSKKTQTPTKTLMDNSNRTQKRAFLSQKRREKGTKNEIFSCFYLSTIFILEFSFSSI